MRRALPLILLLAGCSSGDGPPLPKPWVNGVPPGKAAYVPDPPLKPLPEPPTIAPSAQGARVLVIVNATDADSTNLGAYYADKRGVPKANLLTLSVPATEEISQDVYKDAIEKPVRAALAANPAIDFLLLVRGMPLRVKEGGYSVDSLLMSGDRTLLSLPKGQGLTSYQYADNPYYRSTKPFRHRDFGIYLACRLDGYTAEQTKALVDSSLAAKPSPGPFLLDSDPDRATGGFAPLEDSLAVANRSLTGAGRKVQFDGSRSFVGPSEPLAGYASWGSNDGSFNVEAYHALRFLPGALVETFVSTSGRTFRPAAGGQSLIADLIAQGVTGVKGYVSEPYTMALARPDLLFGRYTSGANLAESFYAASPFVHWKDVVIGDPLCAPYAK